MTTSTTTDLSILEALDFEPACASPACEAGRPKATHVRHRPAAPCGCDTAEPICTPCVERLLANWRSRPYATHHTHPQPCGGRYPGTDRDGSLWIEAL